MKEVDKSRHDLLPAYLRPKNCDCEFCSLQTNEKYEVKYKMSRQLDINTIKKGDIIEPGQLICDDKLETIFGEVVSVMQGKEFYIFTLTNFRTGPEQKKYAIAHKWKTKLRRIK